MSQERQGSIQKGLMNNNREDMHDKDKHPQPPEPPECLLCTSVHTSASLRQRRVLQTQQSTGSPQSFLPCGT